jgi:hypothetical protein
MVDPATQSGAFAPIAKQIAEDAGKLLDKEENWTEYAHELDRMNLKAYLEQFRGKTDDWAIDLLDVAYNIEFALLTEDQSSLVMVDFIGTDLDKPFAIFGESDELRTLPHQRRIVRSHQCARRRTQGQGGLAAWARADRARYQGRKDRHWPRRSRRREIGNLRCGDPGAAVHPLARR